MAFNLARWFEDLPDGPVIAAWHVLKMSGDRSEAKEFFKIAMIRGIPWFSEGLRLLFELGEIFADEPDIDKGEVVGLRRLEGARLRWSPVTFLQRRELRNDDAFVHQRQPSFAG